MYIRKEERSKISNLNSALKKIREKKDEYKSKARRRKGIKNREEISEIDNRKTV